MIVILNAGTPVLSENAHEEFWSTEYRGLQADRVFGLVRWIGRLRRLARLMGIGKRIGSRQGFSGKVSGGMVPLEAVIGTIDPRNGRVKSLPTLKRSWRETWRRLWLADDLDVLPVLRVIRGEMGWYLTEDPVSILTLEVLRAKGVREVRVAEEAADRDYAIPVDEMGEARDEQCCKLVDHDRDFERPVPEVSKAG